MSSDPDRVDQQTAGPSEVAEVEAVEAVVRDYIEGWHAGAADRMERALHPHLVKQTPDMGVDSPALRSVTRARMVDLTREGGGASPDAAADVVVHHVEADIASARVATAEYLDLLHLVRTDGQWRIIHDLFRQRV